MTSPIPLAVCNNWATISFINPIMQKEVNMWQKHPVCPHRIRRINNQFGWVDHRLVRDRHIEALSHPASALYLFLITVADARGLSYYSDRSIEKRLAMDSNTLNRARDQLIKNDLVAYKHPFYQVLLVGDQVIFDQLIP